MLRHAACLQQCGLKRTSFAEHSVAGVDLYLDNKAVADMFNTAARREISAADVRDEIRHCGRLWGEIFKVHWQRGHQQRHVSPTERAGLYWRLRIVWRAGSRTSDEIRQVTT